MIFPGMAARILFTDEVIIGIIIIVISHHRNYPHHQYIKMMTSQVACADPDLCEAICQSRAGCTNIAFVKLVTELMPVLIIIIVIMEILKVFMMMIVLLVMMMMMTMMIIMI